MSKWLNFEEEVRLLTEAFGYQGVCTPPSGDHGVDILAEKNGRQVAVQVKLYGNTRVGNQAVLLLLGGMSVYKASEALLITTGRMTTKAVEACEASGVVWYDGERLLKLCNDHVLTLPSWCILRDSRGGRDFYVHSDVRIGRDPANEVCVHDDMTVSRKHCLLSRTGLNLCVEDLGSTNGTKVNGVAIASKIKLRYGDVVQAGANSWQVLNEVT